MKTSERPTKARLTRKQGQGTEVWDFLDQHPGSGVVRPATPAPGAATPISFDAMLLDSWDQPNEMQLNIRLPAAAKKMIERLARRKTVGVSTLVRMWVIESLRREARQL